MGLEKGTIDFWEKFIEFKNRYGYWEIFKTIIFVGFAIGFLFLSKNFGEHYTFERQKEVINQAIKEDKVQQFELHSKQMRLREEMKPIITNILKRTLYEMGADRAFVVELHNGSSNTSGLPFVHLSMTYEETAKGIESIDEDYQNISLSRFSFPQYLHQHDLCYGTIDDFKKIDPKLTNRMRDNGVTYLFLTTIKSNSSEIGYFGFTYCNNKKPKEDREMLEYTISTVQELSKLLDKHVKF